MEYSDHVKVFGILQHPFELSVKVKVCLDDIENRKIKPNDILSAAIVKIDPCKGSVIMELVDTDRET